MLGLVPSACRLIRLLDIDLSWRLNRVSDGQRRRVQICMGLLKPYQVSKAHAQPPGQASQVQRSVSSARLPCKSFVVNACNGSPHAIHRSKPAPDICSMPHHPDARIRCSSWLCRLCIWNLNARHDGLSFATLYVCAPFGTVRQMIQK